MMVWLGTTVVAGGNIYSNKNSGISIASQNRLPCENGENKNGEMLNTHGQNRCNLCNGRHASLVSTKDKKSFARKLPAITGEDFSLFIHSMNSAT